MNGAARHRVAGGLVMGALCIVLVTVPAAAQDESAAVPSDCERGVLDGGQGGMNVLVYELCADRLTVGFRSSDIVEEMSCGPAGGIRLWMSADDDRCEAQPAADSEQVYELLEPLRGLGRTTAAPVAKRLTCSGGTTNRATIVVPNARAALLETRTGDTIYERVTRRFISQCVRPGA
jgi:hypothetical protein